MNRNLKATLFLAFLSFASVNALAQPAAPNTSWYTNNPSDTVFTISTAADLEGLAKIVNGTWGGSPSSFNFNNRTINLAGNINLSAYGPNHNSGAGWIPIGSSNTYAGSFSGVFDGNGNVITGLYINNGNNYSGLFGYLMGATAKVKNLVIEGANVSGVDYVGVAAGFVSTGSLIKCTVTGAVVNGNNFTGGLTGYINTGKLIKCSFTGSVDGIDNVGGLVGYANRNSSVSDSCVIKCYTAGTVNGRNYVGGVAGYLYASDMTATYSTASVTGVSSVGGLGGRKISSYVTNCYSTGSVAGTSDYIGGLIGYSSGGGMKRCYSTGSVSGGNNVGGLAGSLSGGTIDSCVSLDSSVTASATYKAVGRIVGAGGVLSNNLAWDSMFINKTPVVVGPNTIDGADISSQHLFSGTIGGLFVNYPWVTANCKLPGICKPVDMPSYLVNLAVLIKWVEQITYSATQESVPDVASANAAVLAIIDSLIGSHLINEPCPITVVVNNILFSTAIAGTPSDPLGTDGGYAFTVSFIDCNNIVLDTTPILFLTIKAAPYMTSLIKRAEPTVSTPANEREAVSSNELTAGPNPVAKHSGAVSFFWRGWAIENGTLSVYAASGNFVKKINVGDKYVGSSERRKIGSWDLKDSKGRSVSEGTYVVKGTITGQDGKKEKISLMVGVR